MDGLSHPVCGSPAGYLVAAIQVNGPVCRRFFQHHGGVLVIPHIGNIEQFQGIQIYALEITAIVGKEAVIPPNGQGIFHPPPAFVIALPVAGSGIGIFFRRVRIQGKGACLGIVAGMKLAGIQHPVFPYGEQGIRGRVQ